MKVEDFKEFYDNLPIDMQVSINNGYLTILNKGLLIITPSFEGTEDSLPEKIFDAVKEKRINEVTIGYLQDDEVYSVEEDYLKRNIIIERFNIRIGLSRIGEIGEAQLALVVNEHTKDNLKVIMSRHIDQLIYKRMAIYEII